MAEQLHGILNINKPSDWTSHDVVARARRLLGTQKVGHTGTLDPLATGVLLLCVGQATRVAEFLMQGRKVYRAVARMGTVTDTYDVQGKIVATTPLPPFTSESLAVAFRPFVGQIAQTPPAFSAIKQAGVPAYRRARRGEDLRLAPRLVSIEEIRVLDWQPPNLIIEVACSRGTYIRSLIHDFGQAVGCGATLAELTRLRSGAFVVEDAITLETLGSAAAVGQVSRYLHPIAAALTDLIQVPVDADLAERLRHGQSIPCHTPPEAATQSKIPCPSGGEDLRKAYALGPDGEVLAILSYNAAQQRWQPAKVLAV